MNIGIAVYSETGNTREVAERIRRELENAGHEAELLEITTAAGRRELAEIPSVEPYDTLCIGGPVHHLTVAKPVKLFLEAIPSLQNKKVAFFVTQGQPLSALGGSQAMAFLKRAIHEHSGSPIRAGIVHVSRKSKESEIRRVVEAVVESAG
ncbi:MAG: hypothetical protein EA383_13710 [Spirochaetaceae bacterium]|nr:MAG: hypothetical protein EA383_13710 [Spirochaetaceae bacterium]